MNRIIACVFLGLTVFPPSLGANGQEAAPQHRANVANAAATTGQVQRNGVPIFDYDNDADLDIFVAGRSAGQAGQGVVDFDLDNDGWPDLFVSNGVGRLYRNNGNGTFTDITRQDSARDPVIEMIKIEGGKVEIRGQSITIEGGKVEIIRRRP